MTTRELLPMPGLGECTRRGPRYRSCGEPATHVLRLEYVMTVAGRTHPRIRYTQLCEEHAREAATRWRIPFVEVAR